MLHRQMLQNLKKELPFELPQHFTSRFEIKNVPEYYKKQPSSRLFEQQSKLDKLPVPELNATLTKYLHSIKPLASTSEYQRTEKIVSEFKSSTIGKELHHRLIEKSHSLEKGWLADYWNNYAYLEWRDACAGNVNFFYHFKDDTRSQLTRASCLIREMMGFRQLIINHELEPEMMKDQPLCSHMYNFLFNTTRIPIKPRDEVAVYDAKKNSHVVVLYRQHIYVIETIVDKNLLSSKDIQHQLNLIVQQEIDRPLGTGLGALTSWNRDKWADTRQLMLKDNLELFNKLQSAAFSVSLDEHSPITLEECAETFLYGNVSNRWFDKSEQLIVCANGKAGMNNEHSMMDGTINTRLCDAILTNMEHHDQGTTLDCKLKPQKLNFKTSTTVLKRIEEAKKDFKKWSDPHSIAVMAYYGYGKGFIKQMKMSPDAFVQMGLQLAYYKLYSKCNATYESAQIRKFKFSRTETCRSVSLASVAFVEACHNTNKTVLFTYIG